MSSVNRNDRLSRRLLGFIGRCEAVEAQNKALAEEVSALRKDRDGLIAARQEDAAALSEALERIDSLQIALDGLRESHNGLVLTLAKPAVQAPVVEAVPEPATTDDPAPVTT